jgi:hypothetical protein
MPDSAEAYAERIHAIAPDLVVHTAVFNGDGLVNAATLGRALRPTSFLLDRTSLGHSRQSAD